MIHTKDMDKTMLSCGEDFVPALIFDCGQCFRWYPLSDTVWRGVAFGKVLELELVGEDIIFHCGGEQFDEIWRDYFDLDRDYAEIRKKISTDPFTAKAAQFGTGIRILNQEGWETLCSFIISACNNITRIRGIIERLCGLYGDRLEYNGEAFFAFPSAERLAALEPDDLAPIRSGYRAKYIVAAARDVASGRIDFAGLRSLPTGDALKALCTINGVGVKVASCVALFGLGKSDAFPIDVWMKRAISEHYGGEFDPSVFGENAGIAQQYIFHYIRHLSGRV